MFPCPTFLFEGWHHFMVKSYIVFTLDLIIFHIMYQVPVLQSLFLLILFPWADIEWLLITTWISLVCRALNRCNGTGQKGLMCPISMGLCRVIESHIGLSVPELSLWAGRHMSITSSTFSRCLLFSHQETWTALLDCSIQLIHHVYLEGYLELAMNHSVFPCETHGASGGLFL